MNRFASLSPSAGRRVLAAFVVGTAALLALVHLAPDDALPSSHAALVDALRAHADFYTTAGDLARAGEAPPMPLVPGIAARLSPLALVALLGALASALLWTGIDRLWALAARWPVQVAAAVLLLAGAAAVALVDPPQATAALLVAWSLLLRRPRRWVEAAALGTIAALAHAPATTYLCVMAAIALAEQQRREAAGWLLAAATAGTAFAFHLHALAATGEAYPLGHDAGAAARLVATALPQVPATAAALLVALACLGWASRAGGIAARLFALAGAALLLAALTGADATALVAAPLLPGLAFAPGALRELVRRARARRRITVTRLRQEPQP